ncbi:TonB-dependent receptor plug domain-containing protein [Methylosinus sp. Sm6]|uniref:TonB-dependent receptor plug domain-containing protein n=1 Tax=Methylosinus sp. Sm6 TaxID=2866948 RepID=UPI001C990201|nr:Plug domain-containing protein [Methylosinus sp. Sm6]MBY6242363.1 TonB-dependent receptor plug domain-containing protein [Methylosinus sp. Sm6]
MTISRMIGASVALALVSTAALAGSSSRERRATKPPAEDGYYVPFVTGPGGEKRDVMAIPGSVTVVSRKLMDDTQATSLGDALRFVPGVVVGR